MQKKLNILYLFFLCTGIFFSDAYAQNKPEYLIKTYRDTGYLGSFSIELFPSIAPKHVANFDSLVRMNFFDSTAFHRVIPGFVIQGGDPNSRHGARSTWGFGDPNQETVEAEFSKIGYVRGILGAARDADTNSATSQFFISVAPTHNLDGKYTAYGRVISGMNIVDTIVNAPRDANDNPYKKFSMFVSLSGYNDSIPAKPELSAPADSLADVPDKRILSWKSVGDAVLYQVELSEKPDFSDSLFIAKNGTTSIQVKDLAPNKRYYWRVKANNGGHYGSYSVTRTFTTKIQSGVASTLSLSHFSIEPNPAYEKTNIHFHLPAQEPVQFILKDVNGKNIDAKIWTDTNEGMNIKLLDLKNLHAGIYFYSLSYQHQLVSGKIVKMD